ncbi:MAG: hypothetical protein J6X81_03750, partial [Muribaculaceae bacterium]|nr:hypothetical protein [Muribaculaceae bacterium]
PVSYDDDAKRVITEFHWPGNVRQLKNVVEQIALFEAGKTITGDVVRHYLPIDTANMQLALRENVQFDYTREREVLFKMIFQLQQELSGLKNAVSNLSESGGTVKGQRHGHISTSVMEMQRNTSRILNPDEINEPMEFRSMHNESVPERPTIVNLDEHHQASEVQAMPVDEDHTPARTLKATERETIERALERNGGVRNRTAKELNISERTLYRKIKEYGL